MLRAIPIVCLTVLGHRAKKHVQGSEQLIVQALQPVLKSWHRLLWVSSQPPSGLQPTSSLRNLQSLMTSLPLMQQHQLWQSPSQRPSHRPSQRPNHRPRQTLHHKMHWYPLCLAGCTLPVAPPKATSSKRLVVSLSCLQGSIVPAAPIIRQWLQTWLLGLPSILRLLWPR